MSFGNRFKDWVNHRVDCEWEQAGEAELLRKSSIYIYEYWRTKFKYCTENLSMEVKSSI